MVGGLVLLGKGETIRGSKWYGKLATVLFYSVAVLLVQPLVEISHTWQLILVGAVLVAMLAAFFNYLAIFIKTSRAAKQPDAE